jgi:hypothetical protein
MFFEYRIKHGFEKKFSRVSTPTVTSPSSSVCWIHRMTLYVMNPTEALMLQHTRLEQESGGIVPLGLHCFMSKKEET